jgi:MFS family permease
MFGMALTRLTMATVPRMGRSHFFAMYSVVGSLTMGLLPILWGLLIDLLQPVAVKWLGLEWNQYSIYFAGVMGVIIVGLVLVKKVEEPKAARLEEFVLDLIRNSPLRSWLRE